MVSATPIGNEPVSDEELRPHVLDGFIGQPRLKAQLQLFLDAARKREVPPDHILLAGPPGLGQDHVGHDRGQRACGADPGDLRTRHPACGRPGLDPQLPGCRGGAVHRRDPPSAAGRRGAAVHRHGGFSAWTSWSARGQAPRPVHPADVAALHRHRRHHARGYAALSIARSVRLHRAPRLLPPRRSWRSSSNAPPPCWASTWPKAPPRSWPCARAARRVSPTDCCARVRDWAVVHDLSAVQPDDVCEALALYQIDTEGTGPARYRRAERHRPSFQRRPRGPEQPLGHGGRGVRNRGDGLRAISGARQAS